MAAGETAPAMSAKLSTRRFRFGDLLDLLMLDTRVIGAR